MGWSGSSKLPKLMTWKSEKAGSVAAEARSDSIIFLKNSGYFMKFRLNKDNFKQFIIKNLSGALHFSKNDSST
jgi:hypothetical protein